MSSIAEFIRRLPKAELHLHLEGTITPSTLVELSQRHDAQPIPLADAEALYRFTDFTGFINAFRAVTRLLTSPEDYELAAWRMMQHLADRASSTPKSSSPSASFTCGATTIRIVSSPSSKGWSAPANAPPASSASPFTGSSTRSAISPSPRPNASSAKPLKMRRDHPSIVAIGLGGDERLAGSEPFRALYAEAREAGLRLTNHAGETTGPEAIREALSIGSERIGHALSAIDDPALMDEIRERSIALELNPTSNVRTGVCASFAAHPLRRYFDRGLLVTLNSDDPAFFGSDVANEYLLAHTEQGFTGDELRQLASNSIRASFLPDSEKSKFMAQIGNLK